MTFIHEQTSSIIIPLQLWQIQPTVIHARSISSHVHTIGCHLTTPSSGVISTGIIIPITLPKSSSPYRQTRIQTIAIAHQTQTRQEWPGDFANIWMTIEAHTTDPQTQIATPLPFTLDPYTADNGDTGTWDAGYFPFGIYRTTLTFDNPLITNPIHITISISCESDGTAPEIINIFYGAIATYKQRL